VGEFAVIQMPGLVFYLAVGVLLLAAIIGWLVGRGAERRDAASVEVPPTP